MNVKMDYNTLFTARYALDDLICRLKEQLVVSRRAGFRCIPIIIYDLNNYIDAYNEISRLLHMDSFYEKEEL